LPEHDGSNAIFFSAVVLPGNADFPKHNLSSNKKRQPATLQFTGQRQKVD
jgi:hypothetical protein